MTFDHKLRHLIIILRGVNGRRPITLRLYKSPLKEEICIKEKGTIQIQSENICIFFTK